MTGQYTLDQTESAVTERLSGLAIDRNAMAAISNLYRAAGVVRNHFERTVLTSHDLTWTGWVVLWVVWVWDEIETRHAASEAGISKSTLTGVVGTLSSRNLIERRAHPEDARRVLLRLTPGAQELMAELFPKFNREEIKVLSGLDQHQLAVLTDALRTVVLTVEGDEGLDPGLGR